jgi:hypothetical protein
MAQHTPESQNPGHQPTNGTTPDALDALPEEEAPPSWEESTLDQQQAWMLTYFTPAEWLTTKGLLVGAVLRQRGDRYWYHWKAQAKECGINPYEYEKAVDALLQDLRGPRGSPPATGTPLVTHMETVQRRAVEWLWYPYLAIGKICILASAKPFLRRNWPPMSRGAILCRTRKGSSPSPVERPASSSSLPQKMISKIP